MNDLSHDPRLDAWRMFITLHARVIEAIDADLQQAGGLPLAHYDILIELFEAEGKQLRMYELAQRVLLSRSSITRLVDQLEKQALLQRQPNREDRRGAYAVLTEEGEQALRQSWPIYAQAITRHFGRFLSNEEAQTLFQVFNRIHDAFEA